MKFFKTLKSAMSLVEKEFLVAGENKKLATINN